MDRAHSTLRIKGYSETADERVILGVASTPVLDRDGDIVEPQGAEFELPVPLLWQHQQSAPVGHVTKANMRPDGIHVEAVFARVEEPGKLKDRLDECWQSVKHGLVRGLSIGFRGLEAVPLQGGGLHYKRWSWVELSVVCIPSNQRASIHAVKAFDLAQRTSQKPRVSFGDLITTKRGVQFIRRSLSEIANAEPTTEAELNELYVSAAALPAHERELAHTALVQATVKLAHDLMVAPQLAALRERIEALEVAQ